jgi:hypothetical protein
MPFECVVPMRRLTLVICCPIRVTSIVKPVVLELTYLSSGKVKYVSTICGLLGDTIYLVYILLLWLCLRIYRRVKAQVRQEQLAFEAKAEGVLRQARVS